MLVIAVIPLQKYGAFVPLRRAHRLNRLTDNSFEGSYPGRVPSL